MSCVKHGYGVQEVVLGCVESYLVSRKQKIKTDRYLSDAFSLPNGVPQGSVTGPQIFGISPLKLQKVVNAMVRSRLDYCNSPLYNTNKSIVNRL